MTAFWLVPELGTDQVLAVAAVTLVSAALIVALAVRLVPAASHSPQHSPAPLSWRCRLLPPTRSN